MKPTVISFYTPDWDYPEYAKKLQADCQRFGLSCWIIEKSSRRDYVQNCNLKPGFILEALRKFESPVFWIDIDGSIIDAPELLFDDHLQEFDIAGNRSIKDPSRIHVGSIWFNHNPLVLDFVEQWNDRVQQRGLDDAVFNSLWSAYSDQIKFYQLPDHYFFLHADQTKPIPSDTVILHRLSSSDLKWQYKNKVEKK